MAASQINQQNKNLEMSSDPDWTTDEDGDGDSLVMSLFEHLEELRWRIFKVLIAVTIGAIVAFIFRDALITFLQAPLPEQASALHSKGGKLVAVGLTEGFTVTLLISLVVGVIIALPVLLYQTWAFIAPGLHRHEKKHALPFIAVGVVLFAIGITLGYLMLRFPVEWFVGFTQGSGFTALVDAGSYFTFVSMFILVFGLIFELPLVLTFLALVGIVSGETLRKKRAVAHVVMWVVACFATPGADIYSPVIIGVAMSCLFELTLIFIHFTVKKEQLVV